MVAQGEGRVAGEPGKESRGGRGIRFRGEVREEDIFNIDCPWVPAHRGPPAIAIGSIRGYVIKKKKKKKKRDGGTKRDGVVLRILAWLSRVIHIWANRANSIGRLS